ncbi:MAG TPA: family 78 glycoside hydrolase catalytic domain, partial [Bacteroidales bacterium]|nr:family 78 glycoside hydrolase catalytic domain [Bacteroidales bacterium]
RVQYQVYDVTEMLDKGVNTAGIMLGNMWWSSGLGWNGAAVYSEGPLRAMMQLRVEYTNGKTEIFTTDQSWKGQLSPVTDNSIYHGETYDARLEIPMWAQPGLQDEKWYNVDKIPMENIAVSAALGPPIRINEELEAQKITEVKPGIFVYDFGTNLVGAERLKVSGNNGDTVVMKFAELLHDDGTVAQENLRSAKATDRYILKGDSSEVWEPSFTYHGYRYVQVEGFPGTPEKENLVALRFYSDAPESGHFESSNTLLNKVWQNTLNGQKGNMMSVPTDCPQRDERLGWMGDAQIFAPTACYNMNMMGFFEKWMRDITDSQDKSGYVYDVNPAIVVDGPAKAGWGDAVTVVPWVVYNFYHDKRILSDNYDGMKAWVDYMKQKSTGYIYRWSEKPGDWEGYGDWISVEKSPTAPISAAYYYHSTRILAKTAAILGKDDDRMYYDMLADSIAVAFREKFFETGKQNYPGETQTANLIPLAFGLTPDSLQPVIAKNIEKDVVDRGYHPTTGFLGTPLLLPILSEYGYNQVAYQTAVGTDYPSWGYMINKGATTMWELWNSDSEPPEGMNSRNHFALGSVVEWYYGYLAGIRPADPGFKKAIIAPMPPKGLEHVEARLQTLHGVLSSSWERTDDSFSLIVTIPANTTAMVNIPNLFPGGFTLTETGREIVKNGKAADTSKYISLDNIDAQSISLNVAAGTYNFKLTKI